jgi:hypothetical protein
MYLLRRIKGQKEAENANGAATTKPTEIIPIKLPKSSYNG